MTEIAPISVNTVDNGTKIGSTGKAVPNTIIEIVDVENGKNILICGKQGRSGSKVLV